MPDTSAPAAPTDPSPRRAQAPSRSATRALLSACFFLSGGAGLVYEVLWSRHLHLLFGSTTEAVAAVLATFMAGLGIGGHLLGRVADRSRSPMRLYGLLEIGVGLYALLTPALLGLARLVYAATAARLAPGGIAQVSLKLALASAVLVPPATLMGGTLPAILRATADTESSPHAARRQVGLLYALNTLGAVLGTLLTGFVLIEVLGLSTSMRLTAVANLGIGALAVARARRHRLADAAAIEPAHAADGRPTPEPEAALASLRAIASTAGGRYALVGLFLSGATVMLYEVVFTRVLGLVFGVSSYAFSLVLAVFLAGLGLGALWAARIARRRTSSSGAPGGFEFGASQLGLAAAGVIAIAIVPSVPRLLLLARQVPDLGFFAVLSVKAAIAIAILLPLSLVAGLGTPLLLAALASERERAGRVVGDAYMVNTAGTLAGSLVTGFVLVERLGTQGALRAAVIVNLVVGAFGIAAAAAGASRRLRTAGVTAAVAVLVATLALPRWPVMTFLLSDTRGQQAVATTRLALESQLRLAPSQLLFFQEGREATVGVTSWGDRTLYVNGHPDASDRLDMATQLLLAVIPLVAHPHPDDVLVVGFGSGVTASAAARVPDVKRVEVAELERAVLAASPFFHHVNHDVEHSPRVRLVHDDARSFLAAPPHRYDAIISEPSNPWRAGVASLFTTEFYAQAKAALAPGGVFAQWVQLYALGEDTLRMILRTLSQSFPELQVWWLDPGNIVVLGSSQPLPIDRARLRAIVGGELFADLHRHAWIGEPDELYGRFLLGTEEVRAYVGGGPAEAMEVNGDDLPLLEYEAPRGLFEGDGQNALRLLSMKLARGAMAPPLLDARERPSEAALWSSVATMFRTARRLPEARRAIERALAVGRSPRLLAFAGDLAMESGDLRAAEPLVEEAYRAQPPPSGSDASYASEMLALLRAREHRLDEAVAALDGAGDLDGRLGVPRLRALSAMRRGDDALAQAERLLAAARPGSEIEAMELEQIDLALVDLASRGVDPLRVAALLEKYPLPDFPRFPREKALAALYERAARPEQALAHARAALTGDALDLKTMRVEARALVALGRLDEAAAIEERRRELSPQAAVEPVASPLSASPPPSGPAAPPPSDDAPPP